MLFRVTIMFVRRCWLINLYVQLLYSFSISGTMQQAFAFKWHVSAILALLFLFLVLKIFTMNKSLNYPLNVNNITDTVLTSNWYCSEIYDSTFTTYSFPSLVSRWRLFLRWTDYYFSQRKIVFTSSTHLEIFHSNLHNY